MKSVSFSDLRNSSNMLNQGNHTRDSVIKRSSSYKNLTYYSSSEDILKRFSSKTAEIKCLKDGYKSDDTNSGHYVNQQDKSSVTAVSDEKIVDLQTTNFLTTVQDLKSLILEQEKTISILQEKNLILQNESSKNIEEIKLQETRIKYLEHMLIAFNTNVQENKTIHEQNKEVNCMSENNESDNIQFKSYEKVSFNVNSRAEMDKGNNSIYQRSNRNANEIISDLNTRPSSADSTLKNEYKYYNNSRNKNIRNKCNESSIRTYTSDSEERFQSSLVNNTDKNKKINTDKYVPKQHFPLEKDRSSDLSDIKNRLDEFTKYAKRTTEQNSLSELNSSMPLTYDNKRLNKFGSFIESNTEVQQKVRTKGVNQVNDSRPPIDPYYKQRRPPYNEVKVTHDRHIYGKVQDFTDEDDENLKERVLKILEKHKYPSHASRDDDNRKNSDYVYQSGNDYYNSSSLNKYERGSTDYKYNFQAKDILDNNESIIPRLDLTLNTSNANDLVAKYLNYQGVPDVS